MKDYCEHRLDELKRAWGNGLSAEVFRAAVVFFLLVLIFFAACAASPALRERLLGLVLSSVEAGGAVRDDGSVAVGGIIVNNMGATALFMAYGLIPYLRLPALPLGINAMAMGVLGAAYLAQGRSLAAFLASLLPHGVLEVPAMLLAFGVGLFVCGQTTRRLRGDESALSVWACLVLMARTLLQVLFPLLTAAALVETYVTPAIAAFF